MAAIERKPYMDRIDRLKQRVLKTKPEMDLEKCNYSDKRLPGIRGTAAVHPESICI